MRRSFVISAAMTLLLVGAQAQAHDAMEVTASALNVRTGPGTGSASIGQALRGQVYPAIGRQGEWVLLQFGERAGWSHANYLRSSGVTVLAVTASSLNVRAGAGTRFRDIGSLARGTRVAVRALAPGWCKIDFQGREGWVSASYVGPVNGGGGAPAPAPAPPPTPSRPRSRAGFVQLAASGPGFFAYSASGKRWGKPGLVYGIERAARRWNSERGGAPRMAVGNISLMNGGYMPPHSSHRVGEDADVRPMRTSGEGPVTITSGAYSRARTARVLQLLRAEIRVELVLFNDTRIAGVRRWPGHSNHFHLRMR